MNNYKIDSMSDVMDIAVNDNYVQRQGRISISRSQRSWASYVVIILLYGLIFSFWQAEPVPGLVNLAGILVMAVAIFPFARWYANGNQGLPMFELICLAYGAQFSLPLYLQLNQTDMRGGQAVVWEWDQTLRTTLLTVLGLCSFISAYYFTLSSNLMRRVPKLDLPISPRSRMAYSIINLALGVLLILLRTTDFTASLNSRLGAFVSLASSQSYIAIALLAYQKYQSKDFHVRNTIILYASLSMLVALGLSSGGLESTLVPVVILLVVRWHVARKAPWRWMIVGMLLFVFILQPVKSAYRSQAWNMLTTPSVAERVNLWLRLSRDWVVDFTKGDMLTEGEDVLRKSMKRLDLLHQFVLVQDVTPETIPYYYGETYSYLLYAWIPRIIWPEKPIAQEANITFALDYGFLYDEQIDKTMMGISYLAEAYANFGIPGLIIIMIMQGIILGLIGVMLNSNTSDGGRAIYVYLMVFFLNGIGSSTAGMFGGIIQNMLLSALILKVLDACLRPHQEGPQISKLRI